MTAMRLRASWGSRLHLRELGKRLLCGAALGLACGAAAAQATGTAQAWNGVGDAIAQPLSATPGDAARGRAIVANRQLSLCLLCHSGPFPEERFQGNIATDLAGAGARWTVGQLRLRVANPQQLNPDSPMPAYHRPEGLNRVGRKWQDQPIFSAQQLEDVVAFLQSLK